MMMRIHGLSRRTLTVLALAVLALAPVSASAQSYEGTGLVPTGLLLRQLDGVKRVLMVGAHPDDEDTALLTVLARVHGVETAYLSLTRGDGGQNLIGPELWEGLGVIRTGELESARHLDGGEQFFTRAFDFGYSKTAEEALTLWPREELLADAVWVVRRFRPHVIVSVWSGTPSDGHGQHSAAGVIAREAFEAAGDTERFPEQFAMGVEPWTPAKLYLSSRRRGAGTDELSEVEFRAGDVDPLLGRSALQLSALSRSQHRSQDMGSSQPLGPRSAGAFLLESHVDAPGNPMFAGIDTTVTGVADRLSGAAANEARASLEAYRGSLAAARGAFGLDPSGVAGHLGEALGHLRSAQTAAAGADAEFDAVIERKIMLVTRALLASSGIVVDVRARDDLVVPGESVGVLVQLWNGSAAPLLGAASRLVLPAGWSAELAGSTDVGPDGSVAPGALATFNYEVAVPADARPSRLYFLERPRVAAMYEWPSESDMWGLPRDPELVSATVTFSAGADSPIALVRPWRYVGVDQAVGEYEKPVLVVPAVSLQLTPGALVWPQSRTQAQTVTVSVRAEADEGVSGDVVLDAPPGWTVTPASRSFDLQSPGSERTLGFEVRPDGAPAAGEHALQAVATTSDGRLYAEGYALIDYEHVPRTIVYDDAATHVTVVPVAVREGLRVGYIMGTGDDGPVALEQMGASVDLLSDAQVRSGDFSAYDALVIGVRAYEAREDIGAVNEQILDFARAGGTVVVQYQQFAFSRGGYAPYGFGVGRDRVADETATISVLEPDAPVFNTPNEITEADFEGWVQERGLYFASEWGEEYVELIESNDPGEDPLRGSLLVAAMGDGVYVYAALSFFRQWAGRVPGAYRLFANLISLDAGEWAAFAAAR